MAAANSVFDTYELLENIVIRLPAIDIIAVMRVAKIWRDIISKSVRIHDARILAPIEKIRPHDDPRDEHRIFPLYESTSKIKFNHLKIISPRSRFDIYDFPQCTADYEEWGREMCAFITIHEETPKHRSLYATLPPCQAIHTVERDMSWDPGCVVYVKNGVRIGDLIDAHRALRTTEDRYNVSQDCRYYGLMASIETLETF
ncbi:hypothetical protein LTR37_004417 [Vermiconidia calcicola]|uniref:Uncharacterized protein n=1 Tax=Vermiconidia calcicola TaxID=1690605 RepID=A0ACC3NP60_9PEZI|nr:hypothetical protein LTR37_004417 [Vermiconidia calcicola]